MNEFLNKLPVWALWVGGGAIGILLGWVSDTVLGIPRALIGIPSLVLGVIFLGLIIWLRRDTPDDTEDERS